MPDAVLLDGPSTVDQSAGLVGDRQLVCVQTFDIARLTSHPVVLIPGSFIAIGGRGPQDSNESGKTSFLAAVSLLLGDPEWRMQGGGGAMAAALLFEPETAGVSAQTYAAARHGYVVGVFSTPEDPERTALTVWSRVNATAPYFHVRWAAGLHVVEGDTDRERHQRADACWDSLPRQNELGPQGYVRELYGDSPRCLAYVEKRGKKQSATSLLKMNAGSFTPEQIGDDLIRLTGRAAAFESELEQRQRLDVAEQTLREKQSHDAQARRDEDDQLEGVTSRARAREALGEAEEVWRLHFARGLLDALDRESGLRKDREELDERLAAEQRDVDEAEAAVESLRATDELERAHEAAERDFGRLNGQMTDARGTLADARAAANQQRRAVTELDEVADGWRGASAVQCAAEVETAQGAYAEAERLFGIAGDAHRRAEAALAAADSGEGLAGEAVTRLAVAGIEARPVLDIEVDEDARDIWEPRLALYRDGIVVSESELDAALEVAADLPGAVLVAGADGPFPPGIAAAPAGAAAFLAGLAARTSTADDPPRAQDETLGVTVVGGFDSPLAGRAARRERAEAALDDAATELSKASERVRLAKLAVRSTEDNLARARAHEALEAARAELAEREKDVAEAAAVVDELVSPLRAAEEARAETRARVASHDLAVEHAVERLDNRRLSRERTVEALRINQRALHALQVDYWRSSWGGSPEEAQTALTREPRSEKRLRNRAAEALSEALLAIHIRSTGDGAPNEELAEAARRRAQLTDDGEDGRPPAASFDDVARPLRDFLDAHADNDQVTADRITRSRERREQELELAERETTNLHEDLMALQDAVEQRLRQALETISEEYDRLNRESGRFGADLLIEPTRPQSPQDPWRWEVTPRWRRSANGRLLRYDNQANTAQEKLATVQLVLAALLAAPNPRGRVLVLDELGDSFGLAHRREVLREIAETAAAKGVTVLGTCQDSMLNDASSFCGELIYFEYPSLSEALNRPTRMFGFDENGDRVELTAEVLTSGRPWP